MSMPASPWRMVTASAGQPRRRGPLWTRVPAANRMAETPAGSPASFEHLTVEKIGRCEIIVVAKACPVSSYSRMMTLPISRSHSTELAMAAQINQSPMLRLTVENASCRNGT